MEIGAVNGEQERIIEELEKVLTFLKGVHVKNEEALIHMKKPLDDLQSSLKYLPTGPSFNDVLPTEIKENIFSSLCDCNAFIAASVCQEWKEVLETRFKERKVTIGKNYCDCKDCEHIEPVDMLEASATHKMDVHLVVKEPVTEVNSKLLSAALTTVSKFSINGECYDFSDDSFDSTVTGAFLSIGQWEDLIDSLEKKDEIMDTVEIVNIDLNNLNQEKLASCLVNKVKKLTLDEGPFGGMLNDKTTFINELQKGSTEFNLSHLTLRCFDYESELAFELADALCKVEHVRLDEDNDIEFKLLKQLIQNVITSTRPVTMKTLIIEGYIDFGPLISPMDLRNLFSKLETLQLRGAFTKNQLKAIKSLPDVELPSQHEPELNESGVCIITKGKSEIF